MADAVTVERLTNAPVGFAGPVGLKNVRMVADPEVMELTNFVTGANENEMHYINTNIGRDFAVEEVAVIRSAEAGEICPVCKKGVLQMQKGIEVGNTFNLGYKYSKALNAKYVDSGGNEQFFYMGSYGIGVTRTIQACIEKYNDDKGIIWPAPLAPYNVHIVPVSMQDEQLRLAAFELYEKLNATGLEVLLDDRDERAGVKFNDADLIGIPLRVNVGSKSLSRGELEIKERSRPEVQAVSLDCAVDTIKQTAEAQLRQRRPC